MASAEGGVEIEVTAHEKPEAIRRVHVDALYGVQSFVARNLAAELAGSAELARPMADIIEKLYRVYEETDASLAEINPLVVTKDGAVLAIDAKLNFDDNALERHAEIEAMRDTEAEDLGEAKARKEGSCVSQATWAVSSTAPALPWRSLQSIESQVARGGAPDGHQ
jgi:succinyl-CoA synthetase beta subunit